MKVWKLVSGILSIILSVFITFQSMFAGLANSLEENGEIGGTAGLLVAILFLSGGIVSIVARNKESKGIHIALIVLFSLAFLFGFTMAGQYSDLKIWAVWGAINAVMALLCLRKK